MKLQIIALHDRKTRDTFGNPGYFRSIEEAQRIFYDAVNKAEEGNKLYEHPGDFDLYHVGEYQSESMAITPLPIAKAICNGLELVKPKAV